MAVSVAVIVRFAGAFRKAVAAAAT